MTKDILIGIDLGTTTLKAVFLNATSGEVITTKTEEIFPVQAEQSEWLEYAPQDWLDGTVRLLKHGYEAGVDPNCIAGVSFSGPTVMALFADEEGNPLINSIHYNDMRHLGELPEVEELVGERCVKVNGNHIGVYSGMAKQYWWKKHRPDLFAKAYSVHTEVSWMIKILTGRNVWNRSEAGFYGQYNTETRDWDDQIIDAIGFPRSLFPELKDAWEIAGEVTEKAAKLTGLPVGTPIMAGADDASPSALTTGAINAGQSFFSGGSAANLAAVTTKPVSHPTIITYPHCIPGMTKAITVMSSTGLSNKWVRNALCQAESAVAEITGGDPYDYMNQAVESSPPGANGVVFLPYLDGDFTPNNDPDARGCFIGIDTTTRKADILRAALEGMAFSILDNINLIRQVSGKLDVILATGGMTKSAVWMQIISDVTGCSISLPDESEGTPFGNALIAGVGVGIYESFDEAVKKTVNIRLDVYKPNPENAKLYADLFEIYQTSYQSLKGVFPQLTTFRETHCV